MIEAIEDRATTPQAAHWPQLHSHNIDIDKTYRNFSNGFIQSPGSRSIVTQRLYSVIRHRQYTPPSHTGICRI